MIGTHFASVRAETYQSSSADVQLGHNIVPVRHLVRVVAGYAVPARVRKLKSKVKRQLPLTHKHTKAFYASLCKLSSHSLDRNCSNKLEYALVASESR